MCGKLSWIVERRFSEFVTLVRHIKETYPQLQSKLPPLPPKSCFRVLDDESFLRTRHGQLSDLIDELMKVLSSEKLVCDDKVLSFFGFKSYLSQAGGANQ